MNNIENIKSKATELAHIYNLDMIVLFGSRADNTANKYSDVDIAYIKDESLTIKKLIEQTVGKIGENIQVKRFIRYELGEEIK